MIRKITTSLLFFIILILLFSGCSTSNKVKIYYEEVAQVELISPEGIRVLIDVLNPSALSSPATEKDILLTTHNHNDHYNLDFMNSFPGKQIKMKVGEIIQNDVKIKSIAAAHDSKAEFKNEGGSYIFIVDIGDLRIAHFGDIGQDEFTPEQMEELGSVDIAISQFSNRISGMIMFMNKKGFDLMNQLNPRLIIPCHGNGEQVVIEYAMTQWDVQSKTDNNYIKLDSSDLPENTQMLIMGNIAPAMKKIFDLEEW